jgi:hypothetical protein
VALNIFRALFLIAWKTKCYCCHKWVIFNLRKIITTIQFILRVSHYLKNIVACIYAFHLVFIHNTSTGLALKK